MRSYRWFLCFVMALIIASCTGQPTLQPTRPIPVTGEQEPVSTPTPAPTLEASPSPSQTPVQDNPSPTPETTVLTPTSLPQKTCLDTAGFFGDVTIPDGTSFKQNVSFTKTWRIRNEGTCTWGPDYSLVFHSGDILDGPLANPMPPATPGTIVDVSVNLKSPPQGGEYTGFWEFQDPYGKRFGVNSNGIDTIWVKIGVSYYTDSGQLPTQVPIVSTPGVAPAGCSLERNSAYEQELLLSINQARREAGLQELILQNQLSAAAYAHSADMACKDFVDHVGSDGSSWTTRIKAQEYRYSYASENIYVGNPAFGGTPQGAFTWWMNSKIHRENILSLRATEIGIAYVYNASSTYGGYYTLVFARP
ncbi:MAG: hypothetical protein HPY59_09360 [Anaerolineae bacterium]|nr:hypothetical protein [Anaerolineae bacterium]